MTHTRPPSFNPAQTFVLVRALCSLRLRDAEIIRQAVGASGGAWSVHVHNDYDGYLSVVIESSSQAAESMSTYLVSGRVGQIEFGAAHGDSYQLLGVCADIDSLVRELTPHLLGTATIQSDRTAGLVQGRG